MIREDLARRTSIGSGRERARVTISKDKKTVNLGEGSARGQSCEGNHVPGDALRSTRSLVLGAVVPKKPKLRRYISKIFNDCLFRWVTDIPQSMGSQAQLCPIFKPSVSFSG